MNDRTAGPHEVPHNLPGVVDAAGDGIAVKVLHPGAALPQEGRVFIVVSYRHVPAVPSRMIVITNDLCVVVDGSGAAVGLVGR